MLFYPLGFGAQGEEVTFSEFYRIAKTNFSLIVITWLKTTYLSSLHFYRDQASQNPYSKE